MTFSSLNWPVKRLSLYDAIDHLEANAEQPFSFSWILQELRQHCQIHNPKPAEHIKSLLQESFQWGIYNRNDKDELLYFPGKQLFEKTSFKICLSQEEITQEILIFGDRLLPFLPYSSPQHQLQIHFEQELVPLTRYETSADQLNKYFSLLPEDPNLCELSGSGLLSTSPTRLVTQAADLSHFFQQTEFKPGDQLLVQVQDYFKPSLRIQHYSVEQQIQTRKQEVKLTKILEKIILKHAKKSKINHPINALLNAYAELKFANKLPEKLLSVENFLKETKKLQVLYLRQEAFLCPAGYTEAQCMNIVHQQVAVHDGRCETMDDILFSHNSELDEQILESYILSRWNAGQLNANSLQKELFELFPADPLDPDLDDVFNQLCTQKIDELQRNYWPLINKPIQNGLRDQVLKILECLQLTQAKLGQQQEFLHSKFYQLKQYVHYFLFTLSQNLTSKELSYITQGSQELQAELHTLQAEILYPLTNKKQI